jgi:hypothetical protein
MQRREVRVDHFDSGPDILDFSIKEVESVDHKRRKGLAEQRFSTVDFLLKDEKSAGTCAKPQ